MDFQVIRRNSTNQLPKHCISLTKPAFAKHLAFAGFNSYLSPALFLRFLAIYYEFSIYWSGAPSFFVLPDFIKQDPTEVSYISNRIGRACSDYLAKVCSGAKLTYCYESAMIASGHAIKGCRPDFYCDTLREQFAIEAKGFSRSSVSEADMLKYKRQASSGPLPVHFSLASVSYNLYTAPKIKLYDPSNEQIIYDSKLSLLLRSEYFQAVLKLLELFNFKKYNPKHFLPAGFSCYKTDHLLIPNFCLVLHHAIIEKKWADNTWLVDIGDTIKSTNTINNNYLYIDADGIGILIE